MKTLGILGVTLLLWASVLACSKSDATSGVAVAASAVPAEVGDPSEAEVKSDTQDLSSANAESELSKLEQQVSIPY